MPRISSSKWTYMAVTGAVVAIAVGFILLSPRESIAPGTPRTAEPAPAGQTGGTPRGTEACKPAGCSGQICVDANEASDLVTTCEFLPQYACYKTATCERQSTGTCGWTQTSALSACLKNPPPIE